jgi:hypothetical protein
MKNITNKNAILLSVTMLLVMLFVLSTSQLPALGTQTSRGRITDEFTKSPLVGVNVLVMLENGKSTDNATDVFITSLFPAQCGNPTF